MISDMAVFVKRRDPPKPGSIPEALRMFENEVRFYREVAPAIGVRVPECHQSEHGDEGTLLVLEDLSSWREGADPVAAAVLLAQMHRRWEGAASQRWPWLCASPAAVDLVAALYDESWPRVADRVDCTAAVRSLGDRLAGRVGDVERDAAAAGPDTLVHGDASMRNLRTSPSGEVALLDWEDVGSAPGIGDVAWLMVSSVQPDRWDDVLAAYGPEGGLLDVLPSIAVQGVLSFADTDPESDEALGWVCRLEAAASRLA
jgi:hypothetical protein